MPFQIKIFMVISRYIFGEDLPKMDVRKHSYMEFQQAIQNLIKFADRVKELDREIMKSREANRILLVTASENGLIGFDNAKIIHEELVRIECMKQEIDEAERIIAESKTYLKEHLLPFEGQRIVFDYQSDQGKGRTCQVFLEEDEVRCI